MQLRYCPSTEARAWFKPGFETIIKVGLVLELLSASVKLRHLLPQCWLDTRCRYIEDLT